MDSWFQRQFYLHRQQALRILALHADITADALDGDRSGAGAVTCGRIRLRVFSGNLAQWRYG